MSIEIGAHTWQFPASIFVQMLSHKTRKHRKEIRSLGLAGVNRLEDYTFDSDQPWFHASLESGITRLEAEYNTLPGRVHEAREEEDQCDGEDVHQRNGEEEHQRDGLRRFLNLALGVAKDLHIVADGSYLTFECDELSGDGGEPLKPKPAQFRLCWKAPSDHVVVPIPIVVGSDWEELLHQATQHARSLFAASPLRKFALVLAYDHYHCRVRFLLFHRGGITASHAFDTSTTFGRKDIFQVILALRTCRNREDLGLPSWHHERHFRLPVDEHAESYVDASVDELIHADERSRGRATHVYRLSYSPVLPLSSPEPNRRQNLTYQSNTLHQAGRNRSDTKFAHMMSFSCPLRVIPGQGTLTERVPAIMKASWVQNCAEGSDLEVLDECAGLFGCPRPHYSFLPVDDSGTPTTNHLFLPNPDVAANAVDLAALHWNDWMPRTLSSPAPQFSSLFVHMGSLVGSSLTLSPDPLSLMKTILHGLLGWLAMFQAGFLYRDVGIGSILEISPSVLMGKSFVPDYRLFGEPQHGTDKTVTENCDFEGQASRLQNLLAQLDITHARGFVTDADVATKWHHSVGTPTIPASGTIDFMSPPLLRSMENKEPYLHSPVDDLFSTAFVAQWAAVSHASGGHLARVHLLRHEIRENRRSEVRDTLVELTPDCPEHEYGPFLNHLGPVFDDWWKKLRRLSSDFRLAKQDANAEKLRMIFGTVAYRGVADLAEIILEQSESLEKYAAIPPPSNNPDTSPTWHQDLLHQPR
ncbi:hypothetical protein FB45DRAFT_1023917 [Roridomyces roridus]|uniref:Fungal-type protein kinase domain-containing protein n=1 Tax=Roridomyces roridus TaxID=1738132 RepID=A0AAD7FRM1_9AGAR|nr:hypothetical protein FB45DRAFT_1023917 [Roridomyces roridus]